MLSSEVSSVKSSHALKKGLKIVALQNVGNRADIAEKHYAEHVGKPFYDDLVDFIGRSPAVAMVIEGQKIPGKIVGKNDGGNECC